MFSSCNSLVKVCAENDFPTTANGRTALSIVAASGEESKRCEGRFGHPLRYGVSRVNGLLVGGPGSVKVTLILEQHPQVDHRRRRLVGVAGVDGPLVGGPRPTQITPLFDSALRTCLVAAGLARALSLPEAGAAEVYYTALLLELGCTAPAHELALAYGDDIAANEAGLRTTCTDPKAVFTTFLPGIAQGHRWARGCASPRSRSPAASASAPQRSEPTARSLPAPPAVRVVVLDEPPLLSEIPGREQAMAVIGPIVEAGVQSGGSPEAVEQFLDFFSGGAFRQLEPALRRRMVGNGRAVFGTELGWDTYRPDDATLAGIPADRGHGRP